MSAGDGYKYLLNSVRNADLDALPPMAAMPGRGSHPGIGRVRAEGSWVDPVAAYYAAAGTPPGFWLGNAVHDLGHGELAPGDAVTVEHLERLLGQGLDPITGAPLGRRYPKYKPVADRVAERAARLDPGLSPQERQAAVDVITAEEVAAGEKRPTAGFDLTFSVPKSVSVLWALSDRTTQAIILAAHHQAVAETLELIENLFAGTRMGADAGDGSVCFAEVTGLVAMGYDHWDSRAHDPQLHTHVVVANKVRTLVDGKWRTLDSRALFNANVAYSEYYNAVLADRLTASLGVTWSRRERGRDRTAQMEIDGVPDDLLAEFSSRSAEIEHSADALIENYRRSHGREPSKRTIVKLRAQATLMTRPPKTLRSLGDLTQWWRERATRVLGRDSRTWVRDLLSEAARRTGTGPARLHTAADVPAEAVQKAAAAVVAVVGDKRATWRHANLRAEAERQAMEWRFATARDRTEVIGRVVAAAEGASVALTPPDLAPTPEFLLRADGTSMLRPRHAAVFTSEAVLRAEENLLALSGDTTGPVVAGSLLGQIADDAVTQGIVSASQADAVVSVATSGRVVDVLVGPAGTGKTTTMRLLRAAWEHAHGTGSVVGLAPSAAAAEVLASELRIDCENTAKWLHDHHAGRLNFRPGQLVIVDEASLAGSHTLHAITRHAAEVGAKVLLVGDPAQLSAVETGGAFNLLVSERRRTTGDVPELVEVHRFTNEWEKAASLSLRDGDPRVLALYEEHGRIVTGTTEEVAEAAYTRWKTDIDAGRVSVLMAPDNATVTELNRRARAERLLAGVVDDGRAVRLAGDVEASVGDVILTRRNDRRLRHSPGGWVRNGNLWHVVAVHRDGSITARRLDPDDNTTSSPGRPGTVRLPATYVAEHVDLGYATTVHRSEGLTVDTGYELVTPTMTREALYVGGTRGRDLNVLFVPVDAPDRDGNHEHAVGHEPDEVPQQARARATLAGILARSGAEPSAHDTRHAEHEQYASIARLAAEYETIAQHAQKPRWTYLVVHALRRNGFENQEIAEVLESETFGPLCAELRRAEADGHHVDTLLPRLAAGRTLFDADDVAAVLHHRLAHATARPATHQPARIAGLIPQAIGDFRDDVNDALEARAQLIGQRARHLAAQAIHDQEPWTSKVPRCPAEDAAQWLERVVVVAAYRDKYGITSDQALGDAPRSIAQSDDARRLAARLRNPVVNSNSPRDRHESQRHGHSGPSL
ncbi:MobF family relaxase [Antribacter gilvus]|uniref:MobF family relaxase n=1 Tax=Antribacter gilvus TaxID=2304675 RepID=UPI001F0CA079|nr:MobF family relaxase [Antribacter gilvus]